MPLLERDPTGCLTRGFAFSRFIIPVLSFWSGVCSGWAADEGGSSRHVLYFFRTGAASVTAGNVARRVLEERVEFGVRPHYFALSRPRKASGFVGSIAELDERQDFSLVDSKHPLLVPNWFLILKMSSRWGAHILWNELRATAGNAAIGDPDGIFVLKGPIFSVFGRYPNSSGWTPFAGLGVAYYEGGFDHAGWWANGYASDADYRALGPEPRYGKIRRMYVHDTTGMAAYVGVEGRIWRRLHADCMLRYVWVESDVAFAGYQKGEVLYLKGPFSVPFDHYSIGLGLKWVF